MTCRYSFGGIHCTKGVMDSLSYFVTRVDDTVKERLIALCPLENDPGVMCFVKCSETQVVGDENLKHLSLDVVGYQSV